MPTLESAIRIHLLPRQQLVLRVHGWSMSKYPKIWSLQDKWRSSDNERPTQDSFSKHLRFAWAFRKATKVDYCMDPDVLVSILVNQRVQLTRCSVRAHWPRHTIPIPSITQNVITFKPEGIVRQGIPRRATPSGLKVITYCFIDGEIHRHGITILYYLKHTCPRNQSNSVRFQMLTVINTAHAVKSTI